jgi:hypothetical protein
MTENDAIAQKPFCGPHNMVENRMLQIQHTGGNHLLTRLKEALKSACFKGFWLRASVAAGVVHPAVAGRPPWTQQ